MASRTEASCAEHDVQKSPSITGNIPNSERRDEKHYSWSRDAEAHDMIHMRSDPSCVMARFSIPVKTKKKTRLNETTPKETDERTRGKEQVEKVHKTMDQHGFEKKKRHRDLEQEVKNAEPAVARKTGRKKKDAAAAKAAAATAAAATDEKKEAAEAEETMKMEKEAEAAKAAATMSTKEEEDKDEEILALIHDRRLIQKERAYS